MKFKQKIQNHIFKPITHSNPKKRPIPPAQFDQLNDFRFKKKPKTNNSVENSDTTNLQPKFDEDEMKNVNYIISFSING
jgi:hypothetical protein